MTSLSRKTGEISKPMLCFVSGVAFAGIIFFATRQRPEVTVVPTQHPAEPIESKSPLQVQPPPIAKQPDTKSSGARTPDEDLFYAARNNDLTSLKALIEKGAKVDTKDEKGWTPLHVAALKGRHSAAEFLIEHGADVNAEDEDGWTPLHIATLKGNSLVVDLLLKNHANVDAGDSDGWTALHIAAKQNHLWILDALVDAGADVDAEDIHGETPLKFAVDSGSTDAAQALRTKGALLVSGHASGSAK